MNVKCVFVVMAVLLTISMTSARRRRISRRPYSNSCACPCSQKTVYISDVATQIPAYVEAIDYVQSARQPCCSCSCCNDQLILPPLAAELPRGLGYLPAALPLVAKCFNPALEYLTTGAYLPVASSCDCLTLAAPICPDWAPLVKPVIL